LSGCLRHAEIDYLRAYLCNFYAQCAHLSA